MTDWLKQLVRMVRNAQPEECILWQGPSDADGYGRVKFGGKNMSASRAILVMVTGVNPPKLGR